MLSFFDTSYFIASQGSLFSFLTLITLGKKFRRVHFEILFLIFQENKDWHFMQIVPMETIRMKSQILFCMKNKKNIINLSSAELAERVAKVKCRGDPNVYTCNK